jgi:hypothetical protein
VLGQLGEDAGALPGVQLGEDQGDGLGVFVGDERGQLFGRDILEQVETRGEGAGDAVEDLLRLARAHGPLQGAAGEFETSLAEILAGQQVLLELGEDLVLHFHGQVFELGDGLGEVLDLGLVEELHDLGRPFLPQGDHQHRGLLAGAEFFLPGKIPLEIQFRQGFFSRGAGGLPLWGWGSIFLGHREICSRLPAECRLPIGIQSIVFPVVRIWLDRSSAFPFLLVSQKKGQRFSACAAQKGVLYF